MPVTTDSTALTSRFDMLFSESMKRYVKKNGGAQYIRELVLKDIMTKLNGSRGRLLTPAEIREIEEAYDKEIAKEEGKVA